MAFGNITWKLGKKNFDISAGHCSYNVPTIFDGGPNSLNFYYDKCMYTNKKNFNLYLIVQNLKAGSILEDDAKAVSNNRQQRRTNRKHHPHPGSCDLHLCSDGDENVWQILHAGQV